MNAVYDAVLAQILANLGNPNNPLHDVLRYHRENGGAATLGEALRVSFTNRSRGVAADGSWRHVAAVAGLATVDWARIGAELLEHKP